jgi:hypothetical protein
MNPKRMSNQGFLPPDQGTHKHTLEAMMRINHLARLPIHEAGDPYMHVSGGLHHRYVWREAA